MFRYTKAAIDIISDDIKRYCNLFKYGCMIFTLVYFTYVLLIRSGNFIVNSVLLGLYIIYMILDFATKKDNLKLVKKIIKKSYKSIRFISKTFSLSVMIYGIYVASSSVNGISIILATLMIIMWVLEVLLEIVMMIFEDKKDLLIEGFNKDIENLKKPVTTVNNFIKKVRGVEVIDEGNSTSKELRIIEKRLNKNKND